MISVTGLLSASPALQGGVEGSFIKIAIFLTGKPRPFGRGASLVQIKKSSSVSRLRIYLLPKDKLNGRSSDSPALIAAFPFRMIGTVAY